MDLISADERTYFSSLLQDLWDTVQGTITVVKEPLVSQTVTNEGFIPGFGNTGDTNTNYTLIPESKSFHCLESSQKPHIISDNLSQKQVPNNILHVKVQQDAADYIQNGQKNLHILYKGQTFNIKGEPEFSEYLNKEFWIFKLELAN